MMNALALVIGNANYALEKDKLNNAVNDSSDFSKKLLSLGFVVKNVSDCTMQTFEREVRNFGEELKKFDVGLFYFSGHGLQINGKNYLTAIDTSFADDVSAKHTSYPLDQVIDYMQRASPIVKILILDACRDNPLPSQYRSTNVSGLAPIHAPKGTLIAFSTSPGEKALDYGAGRNSIYTGSLLNHIDDTNIPIEDFFKRVRTSVYTLSNGKQTSWEHTSLIGDFYFNSGQLIHSIELPYRHDFIADENFKSDGSEIAVIIEDLKSKHYYTQKPALERLSRVPSGGINESYMFLLGRNILQTASGGEFTANSIIKNLGSWLPKYQQGSVNHVLNGILFEIYFNSKGQFRQENFKNDSIDEIFALQTDDRYKASFEFIVSQLKVFKDLLLYIPNNPPMALPIEVKFKIEEQTEWGGNRKIYKLSSVKHAEVELFHSENHPIHHNIGKDYDGFVESLSKELCVPKNMLRLSSDISLDELEYISMPWNLKLKKDNVNRKG